MNIRDEAVLRELNLYPLWGRRGVPAASLPVGEAKRSGGDEADTRQEMMAIVPPSLNESEAPEPISLPFQASTSPAKTAVNNSVGLPADNSSWPELKQQVRDCTACKLRAGCTQTVFGVGDEKAEWLFVGEGPGADEDAQGEPFVGQAGKLLDNMLAAIKLKRGNNVYIANIVKCRPAIDMSGKQLPPDAEAIAQCLPYLQGQIALIKPKLIVALGKTAATSLLGRDAPLGSLRGTLHDYHGIPLVVTYHPAYLLRSPSEKVKAWQDLCFAVQRTMT